MKLRAVAVLLGSLALASCSGGSGGSTKPLPDAGGPAADVATLSDARVPDLAVPEAALPDLGSPPIAVPDAATPDLGFPDLTVPDATLPDLGTPDVAVSDAVIPDAAAPDVAVPDLVVRDAPPVTVPDGAVGGPLPRFADKDAGAAKPFLASLAHLYGQTVVGVPLHPFDNVDVVNPGTSGADVVVTAQLQNYSDPASVGLHVSGNSTAGTGPIDLSFNFAALYAVSAPVTADATLQLAPAGNTALLDAHTRTIQILPKNTIYWTTLDGSGNQVNTTPFIGVFVTPHDKAKAVDQLLKDAASYSRCNAMVGYQTWCMGATVSWSPSTATTPPGYCSSWNIQAKAGTVYGLSVQASCATLCTSSNATFRVFTQADWQGAQASPLGTVANLGSWTGGFMAPADGTYVLAACNPSSNYANRTFTVSAAGDPTLTGVIDQMGAIFLALKARGMQYVNVPQDFFAGAQNVKFPVESLATASANCIDGTLVFASALESMGMRPGIVVVPGHDGHAFVAVLAGETADPCTVGNWVPIETTLVSSATPVEAVKWDVTNEMPKITQVFADGCAVSASQSTGTIYDVQTLRAGGILPAPM